MPSIRPLLACGLAALPLSLATDVLACARWRDYRPVVQSTSELSAVGAPTRRLVVVLGTARNALLVAFGAGVRRSAGGRGAVQVTGALVVANAVIDAGATAFLPRDYAQPTWSRRNTANTLAMATGVGCFVAAMGFGAAAMPGRFRVISAGIPLGFLGLTVAVLATPSRRGAEPASTGAQERTMAYAYLLWVAGLAVALLRPAGRAPAPVARSR